MTAREALGAAVRDFYQQSWRLFALNAALSVSAGGVALLATFWRAGVLFVVLLGPLAAALMHCAVTLVRTEDLRLAEAVAGLRLHWRRGLVVGALAAAAIFLGAYGIVFYGRLHGLAVTLAFATLYFLFVGGLYLLFLLAVAVDDPGLRFRAAAARALELVVSRPAAALGLGGALALVNLVGIAAALMPFLTLTLAYSFLAAARFALPDAASEAPS
jgi:hypothetical protein